MMLLTRFLCRLQNFIYFLIGQLATRMNNGLNPKHELMKYHDFFTNNVSSHDTVLDIGCGIGFVAYNVSKKAKHVIGIDILSSSIEKAKKRFHRPNLDFITGDATIYKFDNEFDVIILSNVLEHIEKRVELLKKVKKLAPKLLIRVPMFNRDWLTPYKKSIGVEWRLDLTHTIEYTIETFRDEMHRAGLKIENYSIQFGEIWAVIQHEK
jgi:2-polyprenyl-3-methyl-5-hydroxy-6-metoxy-1,4-benzoquinol methylase